MDLATMDMDAVVQPTSLEQSHGTSSQVCACPEADRSKEFSQASVAGLFLTLALCLLSQPLGSLIHRQSRFSSRWNILVLGLWRLNPLACVIEALVIVSIMGMTAWKLMRENHHQYERIADRRQWRPTFQKMAVALLLLRAQKRAQDGEEIIAKILMTGYLKDHSDALEYYLDHNPEARPAHPREVLGSNALAQSEIFVHLAALASVALAIIKIFAISLPWKVAIPASFMISGWLSVQALLLLLHGSELGEIGIEEIASLTEDINNHPPLSGSWLFIPGLAKVPVAAYFATMFTFYRDNRLSWHSIIAAIIETAGAIINPIFIPLYILLFVFPVVFLFPIAIASSYITDAEITFIMKLGWFFWDFLVLYFSVLTPYLQPPLSLSLWKVNEVAVLPKPVAVLINITFIIVLFIAMLDLYNPSETFKPEWLDWLG
ncbi:hypothetical protein AUP68_10635 [Ilyonectria robusta]